MQYVVNHAEVSAIGCSAAVLSTVLEVAHDSPGLKLVVRTSSVVFVVGGAACCVLVHLGVWVRCPGNVGSKL